MNQEKNIYLCLAHMSETGEEMKYINRVFDEHWVAPLGPNVDGFEEDLKQFIVQSSEGKVIPGLENKEVAVLVSGTAAVHLGLVALRLALLAENIESRPLWKPMHKQPVYQDAPAYVNGVSEGIFRRGLCLPSGPLVTDDDVRRIIGTIKENIIY